MYSDYKTIHNQEQSTDIQITTGANTLVIDGMSVDVAYDEEGNMKVNDQIITNTVHNQDEPVFSQLKVPFGKRAQITLSDSTVLWVNTGTTVVYPVTFAKEKREIYIEGEVYASVRRDENRPFIIKTKQVEVQVTGTELNVTAYDEDAKTDVVLVEGKVNVKMPNNKPVIMQPHQCFSYMDDSYTLNQVDVDNYTYWRKGAILLKSEPIENILLRLARYYNVTMKLPASVSGISCSGKIELKDDLDEVLKILSEITSMSYLISNDIYQIKYN
jgi:ferric-dicitrate binding protein FerR (iron transport regulator)